MFGHTASASKHKSVEWYTPEWVFDLLGLDFDLDPASPHDMESKVPAATKFTVFDDGLKKPWTGRVWMNPPYGPNTTAWIRRMIDHNNGVALVFSRTDSVWCQEAMKAATAMLFLSGRMEFIPGLENQHKQGRSGAGTLMFAFGKDCAIALKKMSAHGFFINLREVN
jgi:DNA N-6-adenine-methyltransferase (Dam)